MKKHLRNIFLLALVSMSVISFGFEMQPSDPYIIIDCEVFEGCFGLIEEAIDLAPENSVLQIDSGIYYEKPFWITKSLTIIGEGPNSTEIRSYVPNSIAFLFRPQDTDVSIGMENISIRAGSSSSDIGTIGYRDSRYPNRSSDRSGTVIALSHTNAGQQPLEHDLILNLSNVHLIGRIGLDVGGAAQAVLDNVTILASNLGVWMDGGDILIHNSSILGDSAISHKHGIGIFAFSDLLLNVIAVTNSKFERWSRAGIFSTKDSFSRYDDMVRMVVNDSSFTNNGTAIHLTSSGTFSFSNNTITQNEEYGIELFLEDCKPFEQEELQEFQFIGSIFGQGNTIEENGVDSLCPQNYSWPAGFFKE